MNIFVLDLDPRKAAELHCDQHVVKMITESVQMLSTTHREVDKLGRTDIFKSTHANHPCAIWVRESKANYKWLAELTAWLYEEYRKRYKKDEFKSYEMFLNQRLWLPPEGIKNSELTPHVKCMPDEYKVDSVTQSYINFYIKEKMKFARWLHSPKPEIFQ